MIEETAETKTLNFDKILLDKILKEAVANRELYEQKLISIKNKKNKKNDINNLKNLILLKITDRDNRALILEKINENPNVFLNKVFKGEDFNKIFFYLLKNKDIELYRKFLDNGFPLETKKESWNIDGRDYMPSIVFAFNDFTNERKEFLQEMIDRGSDKDLFSRMLMKYINMIGDNLDFDEIEKIDDIWKINGFYNIDGESLFLKNKKLISFLVENNFELNYLKPNNLIMLSSICCAYEKTNVTDIEFNLEEKRKIINENIEDDKIILSYFDKNNLKKNMGLYLYISDYEKNIWRACSETDNVELLVWLISNKHKAIDFKKYTRYFENYGEIKILEYFFNENAEKCVSLLMSDKNLTDDYRKFMLNFYENSMDNNKKEMARSIDNFFKDDCYVINSGGDGGIKFKNINNNYNKFLKTFKTKLSLINSGTVKIKIVESEQFLIYILNFYMLNFKYNYPKINKKKIEEIKILQIKKMINICLELNKKNPELIKKQKKCLCQTISSAKNLSKQYVENYEDNKNLILHLKFELERELLSINVKNNENSKIKNNIKIKKFI